MKDGLEFSFFDMFANFQNKSIEMLDRNDKCVPVFIQIHLKNHILFEDLDNLTDISR